MKSGIKSVLVAVFFSGGLAFASEDAEIKFKGATAFYEFGTVVDAVVLGTDTLDNQWVQRFGGIFDLKASHGEHLDLYLGAGSVFWHSTRFLSTKTNTQVFFGDAILTVAYADYKFGDPESPMVNAKFGFLPVKYSRSRNLGEYLFRTGSYPHYLTTGKPLTSINTSWEKILGTQISHRIGENFKHSLFITSERQSAPLHDFSLTYLADYQLGIVNVGAGLRINRLIPVRPSTTTPKGKDNSYFTYQDTAYTGNTIYYTYRGLAEKEEGNLAEQEVWNGVKTRVDSMYSWWEVLEDSVKEINAYKNTTPGLQQPAIDSLGGILTWIETEQASIPELDYYTFKGVNGLAFASLDFNNIIGQDLVLYTEAVLMGFKNRPIFYEDTMERLAVMAGLNIPTYGLLDVLNVEVEYHPSDFVNGFRHARQLNLPHPDFDYNFEDGYHPDLWSNDDVKWSIYLKKKITGAISFEAQAASDHLRGREGDRTWTEQSVLVDSDHWYYFFKLSASI